MVGMIAAVVGADAVALPSGCAAAAFGMRMELQQPGLQIFPSSHAYDVFTIAHGLIMIFFIVMLALIGGFVIGWVRLMIGAPPNHRPRLGSLVSTVERRHGTHRSEDSCSQLAGGPPRPRVKP
jgi:heme/copper-type cytochrome/quinol oxidase subunit 1